MADSSLVTQMIVAEKYGLRVGVQDMAELLKMNPGSIRNQISAGTFPIATYVDNGKRWADYRDVASYIDSCRLAAAA